MSVVIHNGYKEIKQKSNRAGARVIIFLFIHYLQVAITTPERGSWGYPYIKSLSLQITHPAPERLATPPGSSPPTLCGSVSFKNQSEVLWDWTYGFSSLFEKTRKSNRLQISLQRHHFLLLSFSRSADGRSPDWANQAAVSAAFYWHAFQNKLIRLRR